MSIDPSMSVEDIHKRIAELEYQLEHLVVQECEVYSRVVGYYRPIKQWNAGKIQEWSERLTYTTAVDAESKVPGQ